MIGLLTASVLGVPWGLIIFVAMFLVLSCFYIRGFASLSDSFCESESLHANFSDRP